LQNQINNRYSNTKTVQATVTYTEPISKRSLLEISGFGSYFNGESQLNTFDFNSNNNSYNIKNQLLTNSFLNKFSYYGSSLALRTNFKKWSYNAGFSVQQSGLISTNLTNKNTIEQQFTDILPNANIRYSILPTRNININYNTNVQQPNSTQLQPVANVSDPLNVYTGNPNLKRSYSHNVFVSYTNISTFSGRNLFAFINASITNNAIVNADVVNANGVRTTMPVNANGNYSLFANLSHGFPVKKLKSRFEIGLNTSLFNNISFVNQQSNTIQNWQVGPNVNWNFSLNDVFDVFAQARITINEAKYTLQPQLNNRFWQQNYNIEIINKLPWGITITNQLNYIVNTGRADGFNTRIPYWNSSVAKAFLKNNRGEIKISAFDLLNKNQGITRTANQNYIEDTRYNVLQRYFLFSFNYILNKSGKATAGPQMMIRSF
ncbi:MAG: outer membrane beta-barrel protein, partial [Chitinophagaceae bacterium]